MATNQQIEAMTLQELVRHAALRLLPDAKNGNLGTLKLEITSLKGYAPMVLLEMAYLLPKEDIGYLLELLYDVHRRNGSPTAGVSSLRGLVALHLSNKAA